MKEIISASQAREKIRQSPPAYSSLIDETRSTIVPFNGVPDKGMKHLNSIFKKLETDSFLKNGIFMILLKDSKAARSRIIEVQIKQGTGETLSEVAPKKQADEKKENKFSDSFNQSEWLKLIQDNTTLKIENEFLKKKINELEVELDEIDSEQKPGFFESEENINRIAPLLDRGFSFLENFLSAKRTPVRATKPTASMPRPFINPKQQQATSNPIQNVQPVQPLQVVQPVQNVQQDQNLQNEVDQAKFERDVLQLTNEVISQAGTDPEKLGQLLIDVENQFPEYYEQVANNVSVYFQNLSR